MQKMHLENIFPMNSANNNTNTVFKNIYVKRGTLTQLNVLSRGFTWSQIFQNVY